MTRRCIVPFGNFVRLLPPYLFKDTMVPPAFWISGVVQKTSLSSADSDSLAMLYLGFFAIKIFRFWFVYLARARISLSFSLTLSFPPPYCYFTYRSSRYNKVLLYLRLQKKNCSTKISMKKYSNWVWIKKKFELLRSLQTYYRNSRSRNNWVGFIIDTDVLRTSPIRTKSWKIWKSSCSNVYLIINWFDKEPGFSFFSKWESLWLFKFPQTFSKKVVKNSLKQFLWKFGVNNKISLRVFQLLN